MPILYGDDGGSNQIAFNHSRQNDTTPIIRASATSTASFNLFQVEFNTVVDFSGTAYTETFSGTYLSGTSYNLQTTATLNLPSTNGATYYIRLRASPDGGSNYGLWTTGIWSYTYKSSGSTDWHQTATGQFSADTLTYTTASTDAVRITETANQYFTDFSEYTSNALPSDWTRRWASDGSDWIVRDLATSTMGGKVLRVEGAGSSKRRHVSWNALGTSYADMEIFYIWATPSTSYDAFGVGRASGAAASETGYRIGFNLTTRGKEIANYVSGTYNRLAYSAYTPTVNTWYKTRMNITGTALKMRTWLGTDTEPATWDLETTNSAITAAGTIGLGAFVSPAGKGVVFDAFGVGVNSASAPSTYTHTATGTVMSQEIDFDQAYQGTQWETASFSTTETTGDVKLQVYYTASTACDTIVPDSALSGNSSGFDVSASPINISGLDTSTYNKICLKVTLTYTGGSPTLNDWTVTWTTTATDLQQQHTRWRNDNGSQTTATFLLPEDTGLADLETASTTRLRFLVANAGSLISSAFRLEVAQAETCSSGSYTAVPTDDSGAWKIAGSSNLTDGEATTNVASGLTDPATYSFTAGEVKDTGNQTSAISLGYKKFTEIEFALQAVSGNAVSGNQYCFRLTNAGSAGSFTYTTYATATVAGLGLSTDIVNASGESIASPSVSMTEIPFSFAFQSALGTLGVDAQRVRVTNETGNAQWTLTIAGSSATAYWDDASSDYDFNDPTANAGDGGDADSIGGQMTIDASAGTVTPKSGCSTTGITRGGSASFSEGSANSITLLSAGATAETSCYWDFTDIDISQTIPAEQAVGAYSINMVLTVTAI
jgi:hypothetical protein